MASFNKVILMGNLTRDPQTKFLPSQTALCEFGLAVSRKFKTKDGRDGEDVVFVDCAAFGKTAEVISKYCQKGKPIMLEGRLKFDTWEDKNGGGKRSKLSIVAESIQLLGARPDGQAKPSGGRSDDAGDIPEEDIPF